MEGDTASNNSNSVIFSPQGDWLLTSAHDTTIRRWNIHTGECLQVLQIPRPYEGTDITGATGLAPTQRSALVDLGAIDQADPSPLPD